MMNNVITNFNKNELSFFQEVLKRYGDKSLYIDENAYDLLGNKLDNCYALKETEKKDRIFFWNFLDRTKKAMGKKKIKQVNVNSEQIGVRFYKDQNAIRIYRRDKNVG